MQYLVAAGLVMVFVAIWLGVDHLAQKRGLRNYDKPQTTCPGCRCEETNTCQIRAKMAVNQTDDHDVHS